MYNVNVLISGLFARALEGIDVKTLITNVGAGVGTAPAAGATPAAAAGGDAGAAKEEKKEEKKEESDMSDDDMGFGKCNIFTFLMSFWFYVAEKKLIHIKKLLFLFII